MSNSHSDTDPPQYQLQEWLYQQYVENQATTAEMADQCDVSHNTISYWLKKTGIGTRGTSNNPPGNTEPLKDESWLRQQYIENGRTQPDIAHELNVTHTTVHNYLNRHDIARRPPDVSKSDGHTEPLKNKEWLKTRYLDDNQSTYEIATELNVQHTTVSRWLHNHEIPTNQRDTQSVSPKKTYHDEE